MRPCRPHPAQFGAEERFMGDAFANLNPATASASPCQQLAVHRPTDEAECFRRLRALRISDRAWTSYCILSGRPPVNKASWAVSGDLLLDAERRQVAKSTRPSGESTVSNCIKKGWY